MTDYLFLWETPDGQRHWEALERAQIHGFLKMLIEDPELYLEEHGWAKIFKGADDKQRYSLGMGYGKKLTDAQVKELQRQGHGNIFGMQLFLGGDL